MKTFVALIKWIWAFPLRDAIIYAGLGFALCRAFPWKDEGQGWIWTILIAIVFAEFGYQIQAAKERGRHEGD